MSKPLDGNKAVRASKETATPLPEKQSPAVELSEMPETPTLKLQSGKISTATRRRPIAGISN